MPDHARVGHFLKTTVCVWLLSWPGLTSAADDRNPGDALFREKVAPILERRCIHCHGESTPKGALSLSSASGLKKGGRTGAVIVSGKPDESLLLDMIAGDPPAMPVKDKPLSTEEVDAIRRWVAAGAVWPADLLLKDRRFEGQRWWAFEPLVRPPVPASAERTWALTPIDAFVLASLAEQKLAPSPQADRRTLIRRLTFDLIGLPPTPDEIDAFVHDPDPGAYDAIVDRLLASPHYGERWGRHWLDVVHYGDTHGYDKDKRRDHAWPYRDYVIAAFNTDLPYGRFIREQIAGDIFEPADSRGAVATGFIAAGPWDFVGQVELREGTVDKLKTRLLDRDDMVSSTMSTFVSMTVHCARCHDHKFDPIAQTDYYRLQAVFAGVDRGDRPYVSASQTERLLLLEKRRAALAARTQSVADRIAALTCPDVADLDNQISALHRQLRLSPKVVPDQLSPSNGYHSAIHPQAEATAWVQVDLGAVMPIDEIRLIPARPTDFPDTPGFGFPGRFHVDLSNDPTFVRAERLVSIEQPDRVTLDDEPYVVRPQGRPSRFVRVTATRLWKRHDDYVFALGELEVISAGANRASGASVTALDSIEGGRWARTNVVDGFDSRHALPLATDTVAG
jgi:mono/diheme cytochrome c family protein